MNDDLRDASDAVLALTMGTWRKGGLREVYRRYGADVYGLALRITRSTALAEDVTQEVFLRLWRNPERFDPERGSLRSYLLAQTHGRAVDLIRSEVARSRREEREGRMPSPPPASDPEESAWTQTVSDEVRKALAVLREEERVPIEMAYFEGLSYREVASRLGQPEGTVKSRIRSGLGRMRSALDEAGLRET